MLKLKIMTTTETLFEGETESIIFPGDTGTFEVCPLHKPLISRLMPGAIIFNREVFPIRHGVVRVSRNRVTALVEVK